jgi:beta-xylosidase
MPSALAKRPIRTLFGHLVSEPADLDLWCSLIGTLMQHLLRRYGLSRVLTWKFSVWHQPDTPSRLYGFERPEDFYEFYRRTYETVKGCHKDIPFGLPATFYLNEQEHSNWYLALLNWSRSHRCTPDFISFVFYDLKRATGKTQSRSTFGFVDAMVLNRDPNGLKEFISNIRNDLRSCGFEKLPVYVCEWNNTPSQQDLLNDTCYKSCYIVKNILENYDRLSGLSYWSLTDLMAEAPLPEQLLFGGSGLFTVNALPKASYYACYLLAQLGDTFLARGNGWFATRTSQDIRIMAYHYKHISDLYSMGERFDMTETDRYTMFEPTESLDLQIRLLQMEDREYQLTEYSVNRKAGSLYDAWVSMGCMDPENEVEGYFLAAKSAPSVHKSKLAAQDGALLLHLSMELLEVRLLIIR